MVNLIQQDYKKNVFLFNQIKNLLRKDLDINIPIEHVGSTVIPNMYGKNIIDILIGANDNNEFNFIKDVLEKQGYFSSERKDNYQFFASKCEETGNGDIHIHLVITNSERYQDFLLLRDYLLSNSEEAYNYSMYKKELIEKGYTNREDYKRMKSIYVNKLIEKARKLK